jgi:hypothetical protein
MSACPYARFAALTLSAVLVIAPGLARADIPELLACADKTDNAERLACYDAAASKLKKQMGEAEKRSVTLFGFKLPSFDGSDETTEGESPELAPKTINQVDSTVKSTTKDFAGHLIVTLANGQSWRLDDYRPARGITIAGTPIQIVRNIFGGFYMGVDGQNNELSVIRIK